MSQLQDRLRAYRERELSKVEAVTKQLENNSSLTETNNTSGFAYPVGLEDLELTLANTFPPSEQIARYVQVALEEEVDKVANTGEGNRNNQLNDSAFRLGQMCNADFMLDPNLVARALMQAAKTAGLSERESLTTIKSGLKAGQKKPREKLL